MIPVWQEKVKIEADVLKLKEYVKIQGWYFKWVIHAAQAQTM